MLYEELTEKIIQACYEVSNELGAGFLESVYHNALMMALNQIGLKAQAQFPINVVFRGETVGQFFADIFVEDKVIVELKAATALSPLHQAQVINYLQATGIEVGLLVNFGKPKVEIKRLSKPNHLT